MADTEKRTGRPRKSEADRKEGNLTFRTRRGLRERLVAAAAASGRSLSEEVERRVEESFALGSMQDRLADTVAQAIAAAMAKEAQNNITIFGPSDSAKPPPITLAAYPSKGDVGSIVFEGR